FAARGGAADAYGTPTPAADDDVGSKRRAPNGHLSASCPAARRPAPRPTPPRSGTSRGLHGETSSAIQRPQLLALQRPGNPAQAAAFRFSGGDGVPGLGFEHGLSGLDGAWRTEAQWRSRCSECITGLRP
ncbi:Protein of unknown function, partial [Gryllus bimaculatus]